MESVGAGCLDCTVGTGAAMLGGVRPCPQADRLCRLPRRPAALYPCLRLCRPPLCLSLSAEGPGVGPIEQLRADGHGRTASARQVAVYRLSSAATHVGRCT